MLTRASKTIACLLALAMAVPAAASASLTEVGLIQKTNPPTAPSCTAGPLGAVGKAIEEEKSKKEEKNKKRAHKKHAAGKKASRHRRRHSARTSHRRRHAHRASVAPGHRRHRRLPALSRSIGRVAAVSDEAGAGVSTTTTTTASTEATKGTEEEATQPATAEETEEGAAEEAPCLAVSRTTGYQMKVNRVKHPLVIPRNGRIVAWSVQLGRPTATQIKFFDENEGGEASAGVALLSPVKTKSHTPMYHLLAQTGVVKLAPYFGLTVQFPLAKTIKVKKGDVVALTVPTWAPALALGFGKNTSWRASRQKGQCSVTNAQTAQTELKSNVEYVCRYRTARLTYSATLVSTP